MILKGSQRSGGKQLAAHLLKTEENEHVAVHEMRGFMTENLHSAFSEIHAVSKGTKAKQPFFSLSLSPPPNERVPIEVFETAIEQIEQKLGLDDQPRAIVFHEKEGRRHAHAVWSRIDTAKMKAINLSYFKMKLKDISRELYLEHGWKIPPGIIDRKDRNPLNFSREEWQQSKRVGKNPKEIKRIFQESWATSDSSKAFAQALLQQGFVLARGDRRGYVAIDYHGEAYAIARYTGVKTKEVRERLGDPKSLPSVELAKNKIATDMSNKLEKHVSQIEATKQKRSAAFEFKRKELVERQRAERTSQKQQHQKRSQQETNERAKRLSSGLQGIWHRFTGRHAKIKQQNEIETLQSLQRDRKEKDDLIFKHIEERNQLSLRQKRFERNYEQEIDELRQDIQDYRNMKDGKSESLRDEYRKRSEQTASEHRTKRQTNELKDRGHEPEL